MPVLSSSRYAQNGSILLVPDADGRNRQFVFDRRVFTKADIGGSHIVHIVRDGDRLDTLADEFGGDARKWWLIADVNGITDFPLDLTVGSELIIPLREVFDSIG